MTRLFENCSPPHQVVTCERHAPWTPQQRNAKKTGMRHPCIASWLIR